MNISTIIQQKLHHPDPVVTCSKVQGCRMPSIQISTIDNVRMKTDNLLDKLKISGFARLQQLIFNVDTAGCWFLSENFTDRFGSQLCCCVALQGYDARINTKC